MAEPGSLVYTLRPYRPWPQGGEHWLLVWSDGEGERKSLPGITVKCVTLLINDLGYLSSQKDNYFFLDIQGQVHQHIHRCTHAHEHTQPHSVSLTPSHLVMDPSHRENFSTRILPIVCHLHSLHSNMHSQPSSEGQKHKQLGFSTVSSQCERTESQPLSLAPKHWRTDIS